MKKVRLVTAFLPAAAVMLPAVATNPAMAAAAKPAEGAHAAKSVSLRPLRPDNSGLECDGPASSVCASVQGTGDDVSKALTDIEHPGNSQETLYLGYTTPNHGDKKDWKAWTGTWSFWSGHLWYPECSFSTGAVVSGYGYWHKNYPVKIGISGNNYTARHPCW